jgi:signal transduction histidine kinase
MAWIESGMKLTFVEVDLVTLAEAMIEDVEARATAKNITINLDAPNIVPSVVADNTRLSQVITNLLTNAIKYSPDNRTVTVTIATQADNVLLSVKDQGFGIAPENMHQLFQRFQRIHDKQTKQIEGTGLGLYISRSVVEQHGGRITVESAPGQGSTFTVYLPIKVPTANPSNR